MRHRSPDQGRCPRAGFSTMLSDLLPLSRTTGPVRNLTHLSVSLVTRHRRVLQPKSQGVVRCRLSALGVLRLGEGKWCLLPDVLSFPLFNGRAVSVCHRLFLSKKTGIHKAVSYTHLRAHETPE